MDNCNANRCIECVVSNCTNHCTSGNYCALPSIKIGTHEANPTMSQCTDCQSFMMKK